jgi:hypothetical protein
MLSKNPNTGSGTNENVVRRTLKSISRPGVEPEDEREYGDWL